MSSDQHAPPTEYTRKFQTAWRKGHTAGYDKTLTPKDCPYTRKINNGFGRLWRRLWFEGYIAALDEKYEEEIASLGDK